MRPHLATLIEDFERHGNATAIVTYRGNRRIVSTYTQLANLTYRFARELMRREITSGERVVIWGQNGVEWVAAFFGCVLCGVIAVPLDAAGSVEFARRVFAETAPRLVVGDTHLLTQMNAQTELFSFDDFETRLPESGGAISPEAGLGLDTPLQILFTSGTTA